LKQRKKNLLHGLIVAGLLAAQSAAAFEWSKIPNPLDILKESSIWKPFGKKGIPIDIVADAKFPEVAKLSKIAVPAFKGQAGVDFTASLRDELSSATINGEKVFELSGTVNVDGPGTTRSLVEQARRAGMDAVYVGDTAIAGTRSIPKVEDYCEGGVLVFGKCRGGEMKPTTCWDVIGTFTVNLQVIRTEDGNSVYEERKSESVSERHCQASTTMAPEPTTLALQAKDTVIAAIRGDIMPRTTTHRVRLMSNIKKLSKEDKEIFLEGKGWAKDKRLNRACGIWEELSESSKNSAKNVSVIYNLGVCAEYQGDYQTAISRYRSADSLVKSKSKDRNLPIQGIERVQSAQAATGG